MISLLVCGFFGVKVGFCEVCGGLFGCGVYLDLEATAPGL